MPTPFEIMLAAGRKRDAETAGGVVTPGVSDFSSILALRAKETELESSPIAQLRAVVTDEERTTAEARLLKELPQIPEGRFEARFKVTEKGTQGNLEAKFGAENVTPFGSNNYAIKIDGKEYVLEDSEKTSGIVEFGQDITDVAGEIGEGVVGALGAAAGTAIGLGTGGAAGLGLPGGPATAVLGAGTGALLGGAIGAGTGRAIRQAADPLTPGESYPPGARGVAEGVLDTAEVAALDLTGAAFLKPLGKVFGRIWGKQLAKVPGTKEARVAAVTKEAEAFEPVLRTRLGVRAEAGLVESDLPLSRATQQQTREAFIQQKVYGDLHPEVADAARDQQARKLSRALTEIHSSIANGTIKGEAAVNKLAFVKRARVEQIKSDLWPAKTGPKKQGSIAAQYEELETLFGEEKIFRAETARKAIDKELAEYGDVPGIARLRSIRDRLDAPMTINEFVRLRSRIGRMTQGAEKLDSEASSARNKQLATIIHKSIFEDMEAYGTGRGTNAEWTSGVTESRALGMQKFAAANDAYRGAMRAIEAEETTAFASMLKSSAKVKSLTDITPNELRNTSKIVKKLISESESSTELASIMREADKVAPEIADSLRRSLLEDLLTKKAGQKVATLESAAVRDVGAGERAIDPAAFVESVLGADKDKIKAILGSGPSWSALNALAKRAEQLAIGKTRAADIAGGRNIIDQIFSPIGVTRVAAEQGGAFAAAGAAGALGTVRRTIGRIVYPRDVAIAVFDPQGALMLKGLLDPPKGVSSKWKENLALRFGRYIERNSREYFQENPEQEGRFGAALVTGGQSLLVEDVYNRLQEGRAQ